MSERVWAMTADKGCDSDAIREALHCNDIEAVIPPKRNRRHPTGYDGECYKQRSLMSGCS